MKCETINIEEIAQSSAKHILLFIKSVTLFVRR